MPRAIITGVTLTIVVYLFVNAGFLCALSVEEIKSSSLIAETFAFELAGISIISMQLYLCTIYIRLDLSENVSSPFQLS